MEQETRKISINSPVGGDGEKKKEQTKKALTKSEFLDTRKSTDGLRRPSYQHPKNVIKDVKATDSSIESRYTAQAVDPNRSKMFIE